MPSNSEVDNLSDSMSEGSDCSNKTEPLSSFWNQYDAAVDQWWLLTGRLDYLTFLSISDDFCDMLSSSRKCSFLMEVLQEQIMRLQLLSRLFHQSCILAYVAIDCNASESISQTTQLFHITYIVHHIRKNQVDVLKHILHCGTFQPWVTYYREWWEAVVSGMIGAPEAKHEEVNETGGEEDNPDEEGGEGNAEEEEEVVEDI
ncbi:hypothetical protein M422DRAFT_272274 [Sphaerobolus stellatus SS14]|uniref:Uncharacterized protein n=1 Tax=Sphaerobolus stellatus (strain SS14) TaxID=990650 RepID=A0A0C9UBZ7_SPHS4|nr:hypothetical protein M422DRAFT_272274 [Sphaerobolus stellatus SS14]